jgi:thioredoxin 1
MQSAELNNKGFKKDVLESKEHALVLFYSNWSGSCQIIIPVIEKVLKNYTQNINFYKINRDKQKDIAIQYGIRRIPALVFFKNGVAVDTLFGLVSQTEIELKVEAFLNES